MDNRKHRKHQKFYNAQVERLGLHSCFGNNLDQELLYSKKHKVISIAKKQLSNDSNIPFLLVVPSMGLEELIRMVQNKVGNEINIGLDLSKITDLLRIPKKPYCKIPEEPYFVFNIDVKSTMGFTPQRAWETVINKKDKKPLTTYEMLSFVLHTKILQFYNLWSLGSRCHGSYQCIAGILCQREEIWRGGRKEMKLSKVALNYYLKKEVPSTNFTKWSSPFCSLRLPIKL